MLSHSELYLSRFTKQIFGDFCVKETVSRVKQKEHVEFYHVAYCNLKVSSHFLQNFLKYTLVWKMRVG